ncbi:MAG: rod shape-determining protein MreC [Planctomycetota bacterium]
MKAPPLILLILTVIIIILPFQCVNNTELSLLVLTKPLMYLYAKTISAETITLQQYQSLNDKDKMKVLEQKVTDLNNELILMKNENVFLANKLQAISDFTESFPSDTRIKENYNIISAEVIIKSDISIWRRSILINKGSRDGLKSGLTVVSGKRLVGKISDVGISTSRIQLITDPSFRTPVMIVQPPVPSVPEADPLRRGKPASGGKEKETPVASQKPDADKKVTPKKSTEESQTGLGVLAGASFNQSLIKWVSRDLKVVRGWNVFSASDLYGIIPRGLIVGKVDTVTTESFFYMLSVTPAIDFYTLTGVLILIPKNK